MSVFIMMFIGAVMASIEETVASAVDWVRYKRARHGRWQRQRFN